MAMIDRVLHRILIPLLMLFSLSVLTACESEPPTLMKASKQFDSDEKRDQHIVYMRTHHMHALKHKRDETMYQGIRTEEHSLKACINCHVPESYKGKVLRHTDQEHFCTTCHTYVAAKLNCFECHVDHPVKVADASTNKTARLISDAIARTDLKDLTHLNKQELIDLAFAYSKDKPNLEKTHKSGGVSFYESKNNQLENKTEKGEPNE